MYLLKKCLEPPHSSYFPVVATFVQERLTSQANGPKPRCSTNQPSWPRVVAPEMLQRYLCRYDVRRWKIPVKTGALDMSFFDVPGFLSQKSKA